MPRDTTATRRRVMKLLGAGALVGGATGLTSATPGREPGAKADELLVGVSPAAESLDAVLTEALPGDAEVVHRNHTLGYAAVRMPARTTSLGLGDLIDSVTDTAHVKYAEKNATHEALFVPNDPRYGDQYADQQVNAPTAWEETLGSADVTVAVVDQGVKYDHPDLEANVRSDPGKDFVDDDSDPYPDSLTDEIHGTHVAGIAAASIDNGTGVTGIGNSTIISGRALSEEGSGSTSDIADGIQWAADEGADVINLSLGGGGYTQTMKNAVSYATGQGALVVAAAGNDGSRGVSYPAAYSESLAVSALNADESFASYSQYGENVELAAPGTNVLSTWPAPGTPYNKISGTSMATPAVAGTAGLTLAKYDLSTTELRSHLKNTAVDIGLSDAQQGSGRVDAGNAVTTDPTDAGSGGGDGGSGGGGGSGGDGESTSGSVDGSLSGSSDYADYTWAWNYDAPSTVTVELDGPSGADFDLYVNTGTSSAAGPGDSDYASRSTTSDETITIDSPDDSTDLQIDVDSYSGSGSYTLTITESA